MSKKTEINSINNDFTQINTAINRNKATVINAQLVDNSGVAKNDILCGKYRIEKYPTYLQLLFACVPFPDLTQNATA